MTTTINKEFENRWNDFITTYKGSMIASVKNQEMTLAVAKALLLEAAMRWESDYDLCGKWLNKLVNDYPQKGKLVKEILLEDMMVEKPSERTDNTNAVRYGIPVGTGLAGIVAATLLSTGTATVVGAAVVGTALGFVISNGKVADMKEKRILGIIDDYVRQLEKYKNSIVSILMAEDTPKDL